MDGLAVNRTRQRCPTCHRAIVDQSSRFIVDETVTEAVLADTTCERCKEIEDHKVKRAVTNYRTHVTESETHEFNYRGIHCKLQSNTQSRSHNRQIDGTWTFSCRSPANGYHIPTRDYYRTRIYSKDSNTYMNTYCTKNDCRAFVNENRYCSKQEDNTYKSKQYALKKGLDLVDNIVPRED